MSKSRGNVIDPFAVIDEFGADALRFYLTREVAFGQDGPVSEGGLLTRYHSELANAYGKLASRTIAMIRRYRDGRIDDAALDADLLAEFDGLADTVAGHLDQAEMTVALEEIWKRVRRMNRYVEERRPWELAKDPAQGAELDRVLASLHEGLRVLTVLLVPYLPTSTARLLAALGRPETSFAAARCAPAPVRVDALEPLFPKR
jgi:methionyl-tRNA synthetase